MKDGHENQLHGISILVAGGTARAVKKNILVIDAHPDPALGRLGHTLATQYANAAEAAGHLTQIVRLCELDFPWLRSAKEFSARPLGIIRSQQEHVRWAHHLVIIYPLWLGSMPALLKAYLEQVMRPGFAFDYGKSKGLPKKLLSGKSARIVVTMGMPSLFYQLYYRSHSVKSLARNILGFVGIKPVRVSLIGNVEGSAKARNRCVEELLAHARRGE